MKFLFLLACLAAATTGLAPTTKTIAKTRIQTGPAEFYDSEEGVVIRYHGRDWKVDLSRLHIDAKECEDPDAQDKCAAHPGAACLSCITEWQPVAWDAPREIYYMAASTGMSQNRSWIVLGYDLKAGKLTRVFDDEGGGFDKSAISPSGKYLAYVGYGVCGVCCTIGELAVADLQAPGSEPFSLHLVTVGDERPMVTALRWVGESTVEYDAEMDRESECRQGVRTPSRRLTGRLDVTQVLRRR
jgi:hypothetical protein